MATAESRETASSLKQSAVPEEMTHPRRDAMHRRDLDIKGFLGRTAAVAAILLFFHWIPDLYVWFSANAQHRAVVIDPRRYRFILIVAYALCGFGFLLESSGILRELIRRRRHRIRSDPE